MALSVPDWVVPAAQQIADCRLLAEAAYGPADDRPYFDGVSGALSWVFGIGDSPVTGSDVPASPRSVEEEFFVAGTTELQQSPLSAVVPAAQAQGVGRTLAWLLGWDQRSPVDLPRRPVPTAEQLYAEAVDAEPWKYRMPERTMAARLAAEQEAARLAGLAAFVDSLPR